MMNLGTMSFQLLRSKSIKLTRLAQAACPLGDLRAQRVAWEQQQWDLSLLRQRDNFVRIGLSPIDVAHFQREAAEKHQTYRLQRRGIQPLEMLDRFLRQRSRFRNAAERKHDFGDVKIENGLPIRIPFMLKNRSG